MSTININGNITGNFHHFGDNNFSNPESFIGNSGRQWTATERELVDIIFENTSSEQERKDLLISLKESDTKKKIISKPSIWKMFLKDLREKAITESAKVGVEKISHYLLENFNNVFDPNSIG